MTAREAAPISLADFLRSAPHRQVGQLLEQDPAASGAPFPRASHFDLDELMQCFEVLGVGSGDCFGARYLIPRGGSLDFYRLHPECALIVVRDVIGAGFSMHYRARNWHALRLRCDGSVEERVGEQVHKATGINCSLIDFADGVDVSFVARSGTTLSAAAIYFKPSLLESFGARGASARLFGNEGEHLSAADRVNLASFEPPSELTVVLRKLMNLDVTLPMARLMMTGAVYQVLAECLRSPVVVDDPDEYSIRLRSRELRVLSELKRRLEENVDEEHSISSLSAWASINRRKLNEGFRLLYGFTIHEYLVRQRVARAQALLGEGLSVAAVAEQVGYGDASSFSRAYKRITGTSPGRDRGARG
ncbi:MAG: helix-turn-helix domain-containing protein [Pseudohaliea sp.]